LPDALPFNSRRPLLGNVVAIRQKPAQDLEPGDHVVGHRRGEVLDRVQNPVEPEFDRQIRAGRLEMDVAGRRFDRLFEQIIHDSNHIVAVWFVLFRCLFHSDGPQQT
jgi:hypothetical protein